MAAVTYHVIVHDRSQQEVAVSFLPRDYVIYLASGETPETVTVIVRRGTNKVVRVYLEAD